MTLINLLAGYGQSVHLKLESWLNIGLVDYNQAPPFPHPIIVSGCILPHVLFLSVLVFFVT